MVAWTMLNLDAAVHGPVDARSEFCRHRGQAGQRADRVAGVPAGFFTWLATYKAVQNDERTAQGEPPLEKLDDEKVLVWPDLVYTELICMIALTALLMVWAICLAGAAGRAGEQREDAQSVEGAVVLPGLAGNARVLRSVDGGRGAAEPGHRRADGDSVHRFQQEGQRLLHDQRAEVQLHGVPVRILRAVGDADRAGHVAARSELESSSGRSKRGTRTRWKC